MLRTLDGVTGVLAVLAALVGGAGLAALAATLRPFGRRAAAIRLAATLRSYGTSAAAITLTAAVGFAAAGATVAASARQSVDEAFDAISADLVIRGGTPIDATTVDAIRAIRSVDLAASGATAVARVNGARATVAAWDDNGAANLLLARRATSGTIETLATGQVLMTKRAAQRFGARVGDRVTVTLPNGEPRDLRLVGLYTGTPTDPGIVLSWSDWSTAAPGATAMLVKLAPGTPVTDVEHQIDALLTARRDVSVQTTDQAATTFDATLNRLTAVLWALLAVAMVVASVGMTRSPGEARATTGPGGNGEAVANLTPDPGEALSTAGSGGNRTAGANLAVVRGVARDSAARSVFASAAGVAAGVVLGATVTWALGDRGVTALVVPWAQLAACVIAAALVAALAAIRPRQQPAPAPNSALH